MTPSRPLRDTAPLTRSVCSQPGLHHGRATDRLIGHEPVGHPGPRPRHRELGVGFRALAEHVITDVDHVHTCGVLPEAYGQGDESGRLSASHSRQLVAAIESSNS